MTFKEYQGAARATAIYPGKDTGNVVYPVLGLAGEAGEIANKVKKILRDDNGQVTMEKITEMKKELGDVLWYLAQVATELNLPLEDIAADNIARLKSRQERGTLKGSGDNR